MKINLPIEEAFIIKEGLVNEDACLLIYPSYFPKWTNENRYFRSSLWRKSDLKPINLGWKKFVNLGESPDFEPLDYNSSLKFVRKLDGSALFVSRYKGELIIRTRQTFNARNLKNGHEIDLFLGKYPSLFNNKYINSENYTILLEWTTPNNVIVLRETSTPELWLTGIVDHFDYSYLKQYELDSLAKEWALRRPEYYNFNTFEEMKSAVEKFNTEGVVIYDETNGILKKCKSLRYCALHKIKSNLNTFDSVAELFFDAGRPGEFSKYIEETFDFEIAQSLAPIITEVKEIDKKITDTLNGFKVFCNLLKGKTRKEQALAIVGQCGRLAAFCFNVLDNKELDRKTYLKLVEVLKK